MAAGAALLAAYVAVAQAQAPVKKVPFENFKMVRTRNIFDPDRKMPAPAPTGRTYTPKRDRKAASNDYVALTGIMATEDKAMAFFAGSQSEYNTVQPLQGKIAGATITKITPAGIEVVRDGRTIAVAVGQTVPLDDSAPGTPPAPGAAVIPGTSPVSAAPSDPQAMGDSVPLSPTPFPSPAASTPGNNPTTPPAGNVSDVMRRMMERRQKELQ